METSEHLRIIKAKVRPDLHLKVRTLALNERTTMEALIIEGLNLVLSDRRKQKKEKKA